VPQPGSGQAPAPRSSLKNWRVRSRLLLLVVIPTLTAVILSGIQIAGSVQSAAADQRVARLAQLSANATGLSQALQTEREDTIRYIVYGPNGGRSAALARDKAVAGNVMLAEGVLAQDQRISDTFAAAVKKDARRIGSSYSGLAQQDAQNAITAVNGLPELRAAATQTQLPPLVVIQLYTNTISDLLATVDQTAVGSNNSALADTVRVLGLVSQMKEEVSEQQSILTSGLQPDLVSKGAYSSSQLSDLNSAFTEQQSNQDEFTIEATPAQRQEFNNALSGSVVGQAQAQAQQAFALASTKGSLTTDPAIPDATSSAYLTVAVLRVVEQHLATSVLDRSTSLRNGAITAAVIGGILVLLVLALALVFTTLVARSMIRPLRRLRTGALEIAGFQLPETVRRMSEPDGTGELPAAQSIDVDSDDEIGEVARAFEQVHREALRLAANEAALRGNVNAMFVNLSRRSQSLVERQIQLIDHLEQGEQDSERLSSLFQMDHLATRMRRNSENLLVLAGHDSTRRWNQPIALVDVIRAAISEIEQYERVGLNVQPGIAIRGHAVNDAVHLLAELAENATSFSPAETPVTISGHLLSSGGVLLDITDQGVGMDAEEMAHANWRLDNPPAVDVAAARRMGLFVVARLAGRHGIRVRLRPAARRGLTALVWLPDEVVSGDRAGPSGTQLPDTADESADVTMPRLPAYDSSSFPASERASTAHEVASARVPKFASAQPRPGDSDARPLRVLGVGSWPGVDQRADTSTGPGSAFPASSQSAGENLAGSAGAAANTSQWPAIVQSAAPVDATAAAGSGGSTGNGQTIPRQRVDRGQPGRPPAEGAAARSPDRLSPASGSPGTFSSLSSSRDPQTAGTFGNGPQSGRPEPFAPAASPSGTRPGERESAGELGRIVSLPAYSPRSQDDTNDASDSARGSEGFGREGGPGADEVVVPPAEPAEEYRLPIFEAIESDWFRRGRSSMAWTPHGEPAVGAPPSATAEPTSSASPARPVPATGWSSPSDEGWEAAAAAAEPSSDGVTTAGLPKRVPQANLVPGMATAEAAVPAPSRSADATRDRFASFQRGIKEGRAATAGNDKDGSSP